MSKLTKESLVLLQNAYEKDCVPIIELAKWAGITRQALWKAFRKSGVETRKKIATRRKLKCDHCGKDYEITRGRYRDQVLRGGNKKNFCSDNCYFLYLENPNSATNRHKQRIARGKVSKVFDLKEEHVVHHIDGNHFNTMLENFMAFENNSDHIKHHHEVRQGEVKTFPIWDGSGGPLKNKADDIGLPERTARTISEATDKEQGIKSQSKLDADRKKKGDPKQEKIARMKATGFFNPQPKVK